MKKILLLFCLISNLPLFSQNKISVGIYDCRKQAGRFDENSYSKFSLYKNDSLYGNYDAYKIMVIDSLPDGKYCIEYDTYFGKRKSEYQQIDGNSFLSGFNGCFDELPEDLKVDAKNLYLDDLADGKQFVIGRQNAGCYVNNLDSLIVNKRKGKYYIIHNKKKQKLNADKLAIVRDFEIRMRNIKKADYYSTEMCYTRIEYNGNEISFQNPIGDWEGYEYLLIQLGYVKKRKSFYFRERDE